MRARRLLRAVSALLDTSSNLAATLAAITLGVMAVGITIDVVLRKLGGSIPGAIDWSQAGLVVATYLAVPFAQKNKSHIAISLFTGRLGRRASLRMTGMAHLVATFFLAFMSWQSIERAAAAVERREEAYGLTTITIWPVYVLMAAGLTLFTLLVAREAAAQLRAAQAVEAPTVRTEGQGRSSSAADVDQGN